MTPNRRLVKQTKKLSANLIDPETPFVERVRLALDVDTGKLSAISGLSKRDVEFLCYTGNKRELGEDDEIYEALLAYINERLGRLLVVRRDIHAKLQADRTARLTRRESIRKL